MTFWLGKLVLAPSPFCFFLALEFLGNIYTEYSLYIEKGYARAVVTGSIIPRDPHDRKGRVEMQHGCKWEPNTNSIPFGQARITRLVRMTISTCRFHLAWAEPLI
ncbi:hypothetical protein BDV26DRAFT_254361 [Aspergillus bertholletiae]|uniref:Uncharacterized protein n=1 Tax=Aspergillus bertholletiae TaxID=1226010 RepID=A0A5N7BJW9_9EURO|nr:hypothetical protein BDV26DRAFT_254361 [Aspergillus bertholletiae]